MVDKFYIQDSSFTLMLGDLVCMFKMVVLLTGIEARSSPLYPNSYHIRVITCSFMTT